MTTSDIPHEGSEEYERAMEIACEYFWDMIQALDIYQADNDTETPYEVRVYCVEDYDIKIHPVLKPWDGRNIEIWKEEGWFKYSFID